jgi:predicted ATPase
MQEVEENNNVETKVMNDDDYRTLSLGSLVHEDVSSSFIDGISLHSEDLERQTSSSSYQRSAAQTYSRGINSITSEIRQRLMKQPKRIRKNVQELTINKLHHESVGLVGREPEIETLQHCLSHLTIGEVEHRRKELIFIKGYSGVGKSTMAYTLEKPVTNMEKGIFIRGKFDFNNRDEPYAGIAEAFGEIFRTIMVRGSEIVLVHHDQEQTISNIGQVIASELGSDIHLLAKLIPELKEIIPTATRNSELVENFDYEAGQERWKYAFRVLTRVLNSLFSPMVFVFDDLQWVDVSSLEVIDFLLSDMHNSNALMIIGCFRSNAVDDVHILSNKISNLAEKKEKFEFNMTDITLGSFKLKEVNKIIMAMLAIDDEERTQGLAEVCFKRTNGNPFFLIEFMTMLEEEELVVFNLGLLKWIWDEKAIENATVSTSNVVHLLQAKMRKMSKKAQLLLQYAACLGSSFRHSTIDLIWNQYAVTNSATSFQKKLDVNQMLVALADRCFIESCEEIGVYRWVHDRVQEAALSLGNVGEASFQFEIGTSLYHSLGEKELEETLFDVVNLINNGNVKRRPEFAALNLRAAEKAQSISAFHSASKYVSNGIQLLPNNKWISHRELTLRLFTVGTEVELALGRVESMEKYSNEVLSQESCSTLDKVPVYTAKFHKLSNIDLKYKDTIDFCLSVLKELGINVVPNRATLPVKAIASLFQTVRLAKNTPKEAFITPAIMTDFKHIATMRFLFRLLYASYLSKNDFLLIRSTTRMVKMTLKYGVSTMAGPAYATLGLLAVAVLGNFDAGSYFAETALLIQKTVRAKYAEAITLFSAYNFVLPWTQPLSSCFMPFSEAYVSGMRSGNTEYSMWALIVHHVFLPYHMGKPLGPTLANCPTCASQTEEVKQQDQACFLKMFWQMILNLMGQSKESKTLKGEIFNCEAFARTTSLHDAVFNLATLDLLIFFGDFEQAANLAIQCGNSFEKAFPGFFLGMMETFHRGVALYAMARRTKKLKYKRRASRILKTVGKWLDKGNPNVKHYHSFLSAEQSALNKDYKTAEVLYKDSIRSAARNGNLHHAALINERYGDFLLHELGDEEEAKYRTSEAIRFYREWGAEAKVEMLTHVRDD